MKESEKFYQLQFFPKKDITSWELARALSVVLLIISVNVPLPQKALDEIEPEVLRHFHQEDVTEQYFEYIKQQQVDGRE